MPMSGFADEVLRLDKDDLAPYDGVLLPKAEFFIYEACIEAKDACIQKVNGYDGLAANPLPPLDSRNDALLFLSGTVAGMAVFYLLWAFGVGH